MWFVFNHMVCCLEFFHDCVLRTLTNDDCFCTSLNVIFARHANEIFKSNKQSVDQIQTLYTLLY